MVNRQAEDEKVFCEAVVGIYTHNHASESGPKQKPVMVQKPEKPARMCHVEQMAWATGSWQETKRSLTARFLRHKV